MMRSSFFATAFLLAGALPAIRGAEFLVVTRSANGAWSLQHGEALSVNGKEKVRRVDAATATSETWDAKSIGHLQDVAIDSFTIIRRAPNGAMLARQDSSQEWQALLPDGSKPASPETPARLWTGSATMLKREKKDKDPASIQMDELYAIAIGPDAASSAASLVTGTGMHKVPGVTEAEAFRNVVELLPVAIKAFPSGEAAGRMREFVGAG